MLEEENQEEEIEETEEENNEENQEPEKVEMTKEEYEEFQKLKEKDLNFQKLRTTTKKDKEEIAKSKEEIARDQEEFRTSMIKERKEDAIAAHGIEDKEDIKKVLYNFERIDSGKPAITRQEINARMLEAVRMSGLNQSINPLNTNSGHSGYRGFEKSTKESDDSKDMRKTMGISDEERKKYGGDNWEPKIK